MKPKRIQMHRRKGGWRWENPGAVVVSRPGSWGNPYRLGDDGISDRAELVRLYRDFLARPEQANLVARIKTELHGKDLACWCPLDQPCHGDVLLEVANSEDDES